MLQNTVQTSFLNTVEIYEVGSGPLKYFLQDDTTHQIVAGPFDTEQQALCERQTFNVDARITVVNRFTDTQLLEQSNHIHPQNMARLLARALAHESNSWISSIALGNGGTVVTAGNTISYRRPRDGVAPYDTMGWESRLYNETYREYVDDTLSTIGSGAGAVPASDPTSVAGVSGPGVRSYEKDGESIVRIECVLNPDEPYGQYETDTTGGNSTTDVDSMTGFTYSSAEYSDSAFTFDEIGLFTGGAPHADTSGYQLVNVGGKQITDDTGLRVNTTYHFSVVVDNGTLQTITFTTPSVGSGTDGEILYSDILSMINNQLSGATLQVHDNDSNIVTYGKLKFVSNSTGTSSALYIDVSSTETGWLFTALDGYAGIETAVAGSIAGIQNDITNTSNERERMITHLIFSPIRKTANRSIKIVYSLRIRVGQTTDTSE